MSTAETTEPYSAQDVLTDPGALAYLYEGLPVDAPPLRNVVSELILHVAWADSYGIGPEVPRIRDTQAVAERLRLALAAHAGPLTAPRTPSQRSFGTCRDFALLLCSMLRHRSVRARLRCGFATYFASPKYADHWICEYWKPAEKRWAMADAQLDQFHRGQLGIDFDCADLPSGKFYNAGEAWMLARSGSADPELFGQGDARGLWFMRVDLVRDLLALNNQEMSAWDSWRAATEASKILSDDDIALCDRIANRTARGGDERPSDLRELASQLQSPPWDCGRLARS
ncbi:Transglutaminase-like superfamily protein [Rhizobiales bacterium GAS191]|nr:Transglutaminase-like superfamily protein [Rhizobiales bacterium GAS191]